MGKNTLFNQFSDPTEQALFDDLVIESIEIYGQSSYYMPRILNNFNKLMGADDQSSFESARLVDLYIKSYDGFQGDGVFLSKFGLEIRDRVTFTVAVRSFLQDVGRYESLERPREGDLIYFPLNQKCFEIKFVDYKPFFYQLGALQSYDLTCELYEYSNEVFNTGIPEIDILQQTADTNVLDFGIKDENGNYLLDENSNYLVLENFEDEAIVADDSDYLQDKGSSIIDFTEANPFAEDY